jgi:hypothetical protein
MHLNELNSKEPSHKLSSKVCTLNTHIMTLSMVLLAMSAAILLTGVPGKTEALFCKL